MAPKKASNQKTEMKRPVWFKKNDWGYYVPLKPAGWLVYLISFSDIAVSYLVLVKPGITPMQSLKTMLPILLLNLLVVGIIIALTRQRQQE